MYSATILDEMRLMSAGRAFVWAVNEDRSSVLFELTADADPCAISTQLSAIETGGPSIILLWNGSELSTMADAEEATFVAEDLIRDLRQVPEVPGRSDTVHGNLATFA